MFETQLPREKEYNMKLKYLMQVVFIDIFYGTSCFMSRGYWDMGTGFGDLIVSAGAVFLYHCAKYCIKEYRKEKRQNVRATNRTARS